MLEKNTLKSNHRKIYDFLQNYEFFHSMLSKNSPEPYRGWRRTIFSIILILFIALLTTTYLKEHTWYTVIIIALLGCLILAIWLINKTAKINLTGFSSFPFKKMYELEHFIKSDLKLNKEQIETTAQMCFNMAEKNKRNYFKLEVPLTFIGVIATVIAVTKNITMEGLALHTVLFGILLFVGWHFLANLITMLDMRYKRYFDAYEYLMELDTNEDFKRLKIEHLEGLKEKITTEG